MQVGLSLAEARQLVVAAPEVLAQKELELERKWKWLVDTLGVGKAQVLQHPQLLTKGLMQVGGGGWRDVWQGEGVEYIVCRDLQGGCVVCS